MAAHDRVHAGRLLADSFVDDPLWVALYPDRNARELVLGRFFVALAGAAIDRGVAVGDGDPLLGVAVWSPPGGGTGKVGIGSLLRFLPLAGSSFPIRGVRARPVFSGFAEMRRRHAPVEHFHLETIGVLATARRMGVGSRLLGALLDESDGVTAPVWTESVTPANVPFYERLGFDVVEHNRLEHLGLDLYGFLRQPGA